MKIYSLLNKSIEKIFWTYIAHQFTKNRFRHDSEMGDEIEDEEEEEDCGDGKVSELFKSKFQKWPHVISNQKC